MRSCSPWCHRARGDGTRTTTLLAPPNQALHLTAAGGRFAPSGARR